MADESGKRKATTSPDKSDFPREIKSKKSNPPEPGNSGTGSAPGGASRGSDLTQKLVAMWVGGNHGHHPFMTQEVRESVALKDAQEKCAEAENLVHMFRNKINNAETVITDLNKSLKTEERIKAELLSKMNLTGDLGTTIMEHIDYITETLQRCQQHKDHLSDMYQNIIIKQKEDCLRLRNQEKNLHSRLEDLQATVSDLEKKLENVNSSRQEKSKQMQKAFDDELTRVREDCEKMQKQLKEIEMKKKKIEARLADEESHNFDRAKKIMEYEDQLKNLKEQLTKASGDLESCVTEKLQYEKELADKNCQLLKIAKDLESVTSTCNEQSIQISTMTKKNNELEETINREIDQRQTLTMSLKEASALSDELSRQVEKLKNDKEEAVEEMKRKIEHAERESQRILSQAKKETDELQSKHERILKSHVEKYESCLAEMKILEARHQKELSRVGNSSTTSLQNATMENKRLDEACGSLKREKNDLQLELRQIEDLLRKHVDSEKRLRMKLEECEEEAARHAATIATAEAEKKRQDLEKQERMRRIEELETEILKLQFDRTATTSNQLPDSGTGGDSEPKAKERKKKPAVSSSYKKSILKRDSKQRKTRSSPPSPSPIIRQDSTIYDKKITFNFDSSPEGGSPAKFPRSSAVTDIINSDAFFDELVGIERSFSQPPQSSQTTESRSQPGPKKFFKSRTSQSK